MTPEQIAAYLQNPNVCPFCKAEDLTTDSPALAEDSEASQIIRCTGCDATWRDVYTLTGVEEIDD